MASVKRSRFTVTGILISLIALIAAIVLGYVIYMVAAANRSSLITAVVESVTVDDGIMADGVIVRDEKLIYKEPGRVYLPLHENGERVSAGNAIAVSFSSRSAMSKYQALQEAESRLALYQSLAQIENTPSAMPKLNSDIYASLRSGASYAEEGLYAEEVANSFAALEELVLRRYVALAETNDLATAIAEQQLEIRRLRADLAGAMKELPIDTAGYFVQTADGYEQLLTVESLADMTATGLTSKLQFPAAAITSDSVLCKVIRGYTWYTALILPAEEARMLSENEYLLSVAGDRLTATVERVATDSETEQTLVVFRCDIPLSDMAVERRQKCTIVLGTYSGFKIPVDGLRVVDGTPGVFVLEGAKAVFKPVRILYTGDSYYIVEANRDNTNALFLYDEIILGRNDLYDGKIVK